jgi:hypothetical protein
LERLIRTGAAAACSLTILAGAIGCSATAEDPAPAKTTTQSAGPPQPSVSVPPDKADPAVKNDPTQRLSMPDNQKVLYQTEGRRGSADLAVLPQIPRGTLGIVVLCNGPGRILVHLGDIASFGASCGTGPGIYNEIALSSAKKSVAVSVTGSNKNEWALTMGWTSVINPPS